jgi:hypothetical protein
LHLALGQDDKYDSKLTVSECADLEDAAKDILEETRSRFPELRNQIDFFTMETCLCSFKKIFREHHGRYLGYYLERQSEEITQAEGDDWTGIEWNVLWQARNETLDLRLAPRNKINKEKFTYFLRTGRIERMDWMFDDEHPVKEGLEALW